MKSLSEVVSPKLTGRIAQYAAGITEARHRGVTWTQIATVLGPSLGIDLHDLRKAAKAVQHAHSRACAQIAKGRLRPAHALLPQQRPRSPAPPGATVRQPSNPMDAVEENARILSDLGVQVLK